MQDGRVPTGSVMYSQASRCKFADIECLERVHCDLVPIVSALLATGFKCMAILCRVTLALRFWFDYLIKFTK